MTGEIFNLQLDKLTYGGDCLGRLEDGRAVFVPFALPGETVRARSVDEKRSHVRAELIEVLQPSPERILPKCKHFFSPLPLEKGTGARSVSPLPSGAPQGCFAKRPGVRFACGGCHYQHMPYPAQLGAKEAILRDQLARIGRIENPPVRPIVPSPLEWNYRNHVQFHLTPEGKLGYVSPLLLGEGPGVRSSPPLPSGAPRGCFAKGPGVRAITECHLPESPLASLWPQLEFEPDLGLERVSLRLGTDGEVMLILESSDPHPPELEIEAELSVVHLSGDDAVVLAGDDHLFIQVLDRRFRVSAGSFFQVNTAMAAKMVEYLLTCIPVSLSTTLLEVYCGVGLFSAFLAPRVERLIGVEAAPSSCEDFVANLDEFENVELYEGAAEEILPALVGRIGNSPYVLVDPPRAGLERRALEAILALRPEALAYVSCDPSTLGRDAARFSEAGYHLREVTPFDLFPQTYHIESISFFEKAKSRDFAIH
jgi:23S rRNA (uracil1939-C5)-methyltransferase